MPTPPRIPPETRQEAGSAVQDRIHRAGVRLTDVEAQAGADAAIDAAWSKLLGDARDRVATLIGAAEAYLHATEPTKTGNPPRPATDIAAKRRGLKRALELMEADQLEGG